MFSNDPKEPFQQRLWPGGIAPNLVLWVEKKSRIKAIGDLLRCRHSVQGLKQVPECMDESVFQVSERTFAANGTSREGDPHKYAFYFWVKGWGDVIIDRGFEWDARYEECTTCFQTKESVLLQLVDVLKGRSWVLLKVNMLKYPVYFKKFDDFISEPHGHGRHVEGMIGMQWLVQLLHVNSSHRTFEFVT